MYEPKQDSIITITLRQYGNNNKLFNYDYLTRYIFYLPNGQDFLNNSMYSVGKLL